MPQRCRGGACERIGHVMLAQLSARPNLRGVFRCVRTVEGSQMRALAARWKGCPQSSGRHRSWECRSQSCCTSCCLSEWDIWVDPEELDLDLYSMMCTSRYGIFVSTRGFNMLIYFQSLRPKVLTQGNSRRTHLERTSPRPKPIDTTQSLQER